MGLAYWIREYWKDSRNEAQREQHFYYVGTKMLNRVQHDQKKPVISNHVLNSFQYYFGISN